jgi:hypothetical protein
MLVPRDMKPKSTPFWCLLPLLALAACGGQVQGGAGTVDPDAGPSSSVPPSTPPSRPPGSPTGSSPGSSPPSPPSSGPPTSPLPPLAPEACALTGDGVADATLQASASPRELAAYAVVEVQEECSGLGGTHIWLKNLTPSQCGGATLAHLGGHGCMFPGVQLGDTVLASSYAEKVSVDKPGFCIENTMPANGRVRAFRVLAPNEDLSKLLRAYGCK